MHEAIFAEIRSELLKREPTTIIIHRFVQEQTLLVNNRLISIRLDKSIITVDRYEYKRTIDMEDPNFIKLTVNAIINVSCVKRY